MKTNLNKVNKYFCTFKQIRDTFLGTLNLKPNFWCEKGILKNYYPFIRFLQQTYHFLLISKKTFKELNVLNYKEPTFLHI